MGEQNRKDAAELFRGLDLCRPLKKPGNHNPVMTQRFGADPWALVYRDRVYLYMTGDAPVPDDKGVIGENTYGDINKIHVVSSADLVNWTDHGCIAAASKSGAAKWGGNSWAPAAAWKTIDGKDKFFLYFANSGNGIAVLTADDPAGPFTDPIGRALISRDTPTCAEVTWLFDPAVLQDEDGKAYIYFGGGIPDEAHQPDPGTARMARLSDDMISLDGDPVPIPHVPYLFEDSGINRIGDKYFYSYCSNFNVTPEATAKYGFDNGEIVTMVSDAPMGPFTLDRGVLKNPGDFFGRGGNNHHCMFHFKGGWYIAYHTRILEEAMEITGGYRSTNIDRLPIDENGAPAPAKGTRSGVPQICPLDPYAEVRAVTMGNSAGIDTRAYGASEACGYGEMILTGIGDGSWSSVYGADFADRGAKALGMQVRGQGNGWIRVSLDAADGEVLAYVPVETPGDQIVTVTADLLTVPGGVHDVYFTYAGSGYEVLSWKFI